MDPVSPFAILSAVNSIGGAAFNVSTKLYSFIKATKVVNKSVEALYHEVKGLENVLNTARSTFTGTVRDQAEDPALLVNGVWTSIEIAVQDCRVSVEALEVLVQDVGTMAETTNPFKKMFKQLSLNLNADQIVAVRGRIHTHSICLQTALQMLAVALSCSSTSNINRTVIPDLEAITSKLDHLTSAVARADIVPSSEEVHLPETFRNPDLQHHTQQLRNSVDAVLTSASTVIGARSARGDGSQYIPTIFSEFGVPLSSAKRAGIEEWTKNMVIGVEESGSPRASSDIGRCSSTSIDQIPGPGKRHAAKKLGNDPDLLIVQHSIEIAEQNLAKANYPEAEKYFRLGLNRIKTLRASKQQVFDLNEVLLKIAFTRLHQGDVNGAEELFNSFLKSKGFLKSLFKASIATDEVARKSHAYFGLAQIYLGRSHLADAELMCEKCINNWRATTGTKANCLYSKTLQLMASIHQAKGDSELAHLFSDLAVAEGLEANETTPYMLDAEQIQGFVEIAAIERHERKTTERILSALDYELSNEDFNPTHALIAVARECAGDIIGPGKLGQQYTPTSADIVSIVKFLLDKGADRKKPLYIACIYGNLSVVEQLCEAGADVNANGDSEHRSLLIVAAEEGHLTIANFLCDRGANIEAEDRFKYRALHSAAKKGHIGIVELLLERGALVDAQSHNGRTWTPLHMATEYGHLAIAKVLCDRGADIEAKDNYEHKALHLTAAKGHAAIVELLLERGALVNAQSLNGRTPLHFAVKLRKLEVVKTLCNAGADLEVRSELGFTPLIQLLWSWSPSPEDIDLKILKLLCESGADISATTREGRSALDIAKSAGGNVEKVLMQYCQVKKTK